MSLAEVRQSVPEFLRDVFDAQLPAILARLEKLENLCRELLEGNEEVVPDALKTAHDLGGSLGAFGLTDLSHRAQSIERRLGLPVTLSSVTTSCIISEISDIQSILHV